MKSRRKLTKTPPDSKKGRFTIRPAGLKEVEVLVRHRRAMWDDMGVRDKRALDRADLVYRKWARKQLAAGTLKAWVVEDLGGQVVGSGCLWLQPVQPTPMFDGKAQPYLMSMYTEPGARGKGVASRIVRVTVDWSRRNGYPWAVLHASRMGRGLYKGLGFKRLWEMGVDLSRGANIDGIIPREKQRARSLAR